MSEATQRVEKWIPLKPKDHYILFALLDEERYGYAIAQEIQRLSEGRVRIEAGNLHRHLQKLVREGLVTPSGKKRTSESEDERRRYYALTEMGRKVWTADIRHMEALVRSARMRASIPTAGDV